RVLRDLGAASERVAPVRVGGGGQRVEARRDVAGDAGVAVVAPHATDLGGAFEDDEVLDAVALERDGGGDPAEPGADQRHPHVQRVGRAHAAVGARAALGRAELGVTTDSTISWGSAPVSSSLA